MYQIMTHYMRKKEEIEKIAELFARFRAEVENLNSLNLYDINIHAENVITVSYTHLTLPTNREV